MTRRRHALVLLAAVPLFAACTSGSDGDATPDGVDTQQEAANAEPELDADGDVVTRNPSQSEEGAVFDDGPPEDLPADPGGVEGDTSDDVDGGDTAGEAGAEDGTTGDGGATTGDGGATTGDGGATTGDGGATTGDGGATTGDGGATTGDAGEDPETDDPLADIPLDQIESLEDDTGVIIVDTPNVWAEVDGAPEGSQRRLTASTDLAAFNSGFTTEGIGLRALDVESGTANFQTPFGALVAEAEAAGCSLVEEAPYDDAIYIGTERTYSCSGSDLTVSLFGGTNEDQSTEWTLKLVTKADDDASRQLVFQSFLLD